MKREQWYYSRIAVGMLGKFNMVLTNYKKLQIYSKTDFLEKLCCLVWNSIFTPLFSSSHQGLWMTTPLLSRQSQNALCLNHPSVNGHRTPQSRLKTNTRIQTESLQQHPRLHWGQRSIFLNDGQGLSQTGSLTLSRRSNGAERGRRWKQRFRLMNWSLSCLRILTALMSSPQIIKHSQ